MVEQSVERVPRHRCLARRPRRGSLCWLDRRDEASAILERPRATASSTSRRTAAMLDGAGALRRGRVADTQTSAPPRSSYRAHGAVRRRSSSGTASAATGTCGCGSACSPRVLGEHERADEHLAFACEFHEANDMPLWAARGHLGWAEALAARGDAAARARARRPRARALTRARLRRLRAPRGGARRDGVSRRCVNALGEYRHPREQLPQPCTRFREACVPKRVPDSANKYLPDPRQDEVIWLNQAKLDRQGAPRNEGVPGSSPGVGSRVPASNTRVRRAPASR